MIRITQYRREQPVTDENEAPSTRNLQLDPRTKSPHVGHPIHLSDDSLHDFDGRFTVALPIFLDDVHIEGVST